MFLWGKKNSIKFKVTEMFFSKVILVQTLKKDLNIAFISLQSCCFEPLSCSFKYSHIDPTNQLNAAIQVEEVNQ